MAKAKPSEAAPMPTVYVEPSIAEDKAGPGDAIVLVMTKGSSTYQPCYARNQRSRQIVVDGLPCEHVGEAADGTWLYQQRAY